MTINYSLYLSQPYGTHSNANLACVLSTLLAHLYFGLMPISHHPHRRERDDTVLSCLVRVDGVNWINKTRQLCLVSTQFPIFNCWVSNILRTILTTVFTCRQFSSHRQHGQDKTVLCCRDGGVNYRHKSIKIYNILHCRPIVSDSQSINQNLFFKQ